jgi:hypothetical protein
MLAVWRMWAQGATSRTQKAGLCLSLRSSALAAPSAFVFAFAFAFLRVPFASSAPLRFPLPLPLLFGTTQQVLSKGENNNEQK